MKRFTEWLRKLDGPLFDQPDEVQPRFGYISHRDDGTRTPLRFLPTHEPGAFLAVTLDGKPAVVCLRDAVFVDRLGPGQTVQFRATMRTTTHERSGEN